MGAFRPILLVLSDNFLKMPWFNHLLQHTSIGRMVWNALSRLLDVGASIVPMRISFFYFYQPTLRIAVES